MKTAVMQASVAEILCPNGINAPIRAGRELLEGRNGRARWTQAETNGLEAAPRQPAAAARSAEVNELLRRPNRSLWLQGGFV